MMFVETYSAKSFVVRGDTTPHKDVLKDMGGKWNARLTDKNTQDKFGAWLFWSEKREQVEKWVKSQPVPSGVTVREKSSCTKPSDMEVMLRDLVVALGPKVQGSLTKTPLYHRLFPAVNGGAINVDLGFDTLVIDDEYVDEDQPPPRRLLG